MTYTYTDIFCGAGGSSIGLTAAGLELKLAANHWAMAIETHAANFRDAEHLCADVNNYDMRRLPRTNILWASPICTEISPAGGRKRNTTLTRGQMELVEYGPVAKDAYDRTRATFHDVIRATEVHRYLAVIVENVPEVATQWELFDWWVEGMIRLGYRVQFVSVSSAHIGDETNPWAPQWRDRLYLVFTREGIPLPDVEPRPLAWCPACEEQVAAKQSWKKPGRKAGRYRQQYVYVCPNRRCGHAVVEPYVLPAAAAIDWSNVGLRIGDRRRPLAESTMRRIQTGLDMFAEPVLATVPPFLVNTNHDDDRLRLADEAPLPTATAKIGDGLTVPPMLVPSGGTWNDTAVPVGEPMRTRTTRETEGVFTPAPFVAMLRANGRPHGTDEPLATLTTARNHGLTIPPGAYVVKHYTPRGSERQNCKNPTVEPLGTITASDHHGLVIPYRRSNKPTTTGEPLHTLSTVESAGLLRPRVDINDCHYRMLQPREHLRAQRFPDSYVVLGNKGEQTMQAGNAVSANVAQWLGSRVVAALDNARAA